MDDPKVKVVWFMYCLCNAGKNFRNSCTSYTLFKKYYVLIVHIECDFKKCLIWVVYKLRILGDIIPKVQTLQLIVF